MPTVYLSPISTIFQYFTDAGIVFNGGLIWTYQAGTSAPQTTYTDSTGNTPNSNPIILGSNGRLNNVQIWQPIGVKIKVQVSTNAGTPSVPVFGVQVGPTFDQISGIGDPTSLSSVFYAGTDTGSVNNYVLSIPTAGFSSYVNGLVIYWIPSHSNTGASTVNINSLGAVNITNLDGTALTANQLISGQVAIIVSQGGAFVLLSAGVTSGSFTATLTGFTGTVTSACTYSVVGRSATVNFGSALGTSNATSMNCAAATLPAVIRPVTSTNVMCPTEDSGTAAVGLLGVFNDGSLSFGKAVSGYGGFTNSGTKGIPGSIVVTWSLT